jgi:hypothetical protein
MLPGTPVRIRFPLLAIQLAQRRERLFAKHEPDKEGHRSGSPWFWQERGRTLRAWAGSAVLDDSTHGDPIARKVDALGE